MRRNSSEGVGFCQIKVETWYLKRRQFVNF